MSEESSANVVLAMRPIHSIGSSKEPEAIRSGRALQDRYLV